MIEAKSDSAPNSNSSSTPSSPALNDNLVTKFNRPNRAKFDMLNARLMSAIRNWQWDVLFAAFLLSLGILFSGLLPRYTLHSFNDDHVARFDNWTGKTCTRRVLGSEEEWQRDDRRWHCTR